MYKRIIISARSTNLDDLLDDNSDYNRTVKAELAVADAAPELLTALENLADAFVDYGGPAYAPVYKAACVAIVKARGGQVDS